MNQAQLVKQQIWRRFNQKIAPGMGVHLDNRIESLKRFYMIDSLMT